MQDAANVHLLDESAGWPISLFFWWRPLFRLLFTPAALVSFDAYRVAYILFVSLLAPLAFWLLRAHGARWYLAVGAAVAAALSPALVQWGAITFPDEAMMVAFVAGLWAARRDQHAWSAAAFTAAIWLKEIAVVGVAVLLVHDVILDLRSRASRIWPIQLSGRNTALAFAILLGLAPLFYYMFLGGARPGWTPGGIGLEFYERVLPVLWLLPLLLLGLAWPRTRPLSLLALAYPAFFLYYAYGLDGGVEAWYLALPNYLGLVAAALVLDEWSHRWTPNDYRRAWAPRLTGVAVTALILLQIFAPASADLKSSVTAPISGQATWSLSETMGFEQRRNAHLEDLVDHLEPPDLGTVLLVDLGWFFIFYPFADRADQVRFAYTDWWPKSRSDVQRWGTVVEADANATILGLYPPIRPLNEAIRNVYADCTAYTNAEYVVLRGQSCNGRLDQLVSEYERLAGATLPE